MSNQTPSQRPEDQQSLGGDNLSEFPPLADFFASDYEKKPAASLFLGEKDRMRGRTAK